MLQLRTSNHSRKRTKLSEHVGHILSIDNAVTISVQNLKSISQSPDLSRLKL